MLKDLKRPPRTFAERVFALGADLMLAIAFLALSLTANVVASKLSNTGAFISTLVGLVVLKLWSYKREHESIVDDAINLERNAKLTRMIVDLTVEALAKRQHLPAGSNDGSGGDTSGSSP